MDFLNKVKAIIVPRASTLFIMSNGQAHTIPMRREAEKEKVLTAIRFTESKEVSHLSALKSDKGPTKTSPRKLAQRRKCAKTRIRCKRANDRCGTQIATTHQPNPVQGTPSGDEVTKGPSIRRPKGNEDVAGLGGGECHEPCFRRVI